MQKKEKIPNEIFNHEYFKRNFIINRNKKLGSGGFGEVYIALMILEKGKECALKIQYVDNKDPEEVELKKKEIIIIKKLDSHPHLVRTFALFPDPIDQSKYNFNIIAMEVADKSLLSYLVDKKGRMEKALLIQMLFDVITGLKYSFSKGISHSDIKPGNILLFDKKTKKLIQRSSNPLCFE